MSEKYSSICIAAKQKGEPPTCGVSPNAVLLSRQLAGNDGIVDQTVQRIHEQHVVHRAGQRLPQGRAETVEEASAHHHQQERKRLTQKARHTLPAGIFEQPALFKHQQDGETREAGILCQNVIHKTNEFIRAIQNDQPLTCPGEAGLATVLTYEKLFENGLPEVEAIEPVIREEDKLWTPNVGQILKKAYQNMEMPESFNL